MTLNYLLLQVINFPMPCATGTQTRKNFACGADQVLETCHVLMLYSGCSANDHLSNQEIINRKPRDYAMLNAGTHLHVGPGYYDSYPSCVLEQSLSA